MTLKQAIELNKDNKDNSIELLVEASKELIGEFGLDFQTQKRFQVEKELVEINKIVTRLLKTI